MEQKNDQEIDLLELTARFLKTVGKNLWTGIAFLVLGVIISLSFSFFSGGTKRESHMMLSTNLLTEKEAKFLFDQLNRADTLPGLTAREKRDVAKISYDVLKAEPTSDQDPKVFIEVTAQVNNAESFPVLEKTLVDYLNKTEPVIRNRKIRTKLYTEMIRKIDEELKAMDQVKGNVNDPKNTYLDPSELFAKSVELYEKRTNFEIELNELATIKVIKGFGTLTKNARLSKVIVAVVGFMVGLFGFLLYLALRAFSEYYRKFETSH